MKKWKKLELTLLVGFAALLLFGGWLDNAQATLSGKLLRLHVIAHSDSERDQAIKLKVRDRMLQEVTLLLEGEVDLAQAKQVLTRALPALAAAGQDTVHQEGETYEVRTSLEQVFFPTKEYEGFALPAGRYTAVRVVLGDGAGANWWCVLFPPLCTGVSTESISELAQTAGLTGAEIALMTGEEEGYVFRFHCVELWEQVKQLFS